MKFLNNLITVPAIALLSLYICTFQSAAQESGSAADNEIEEIITIGTRSQTRAVEDSLVPVDII
ncbi:MAG: hypothetical protein OXG54_07640, partial [Gammaproteobacteria bacterium]|nr:hypothetical protein [Gammaproteobacteria bacterium]